MLCGDDDDDYGDNSFWDDFFLFTFGADRAKSITSSSSSVILLYNWHTVDTHTHTHAQYIQRPVYVCCAPTSQWLSWCSWRALVCRVSTNHIWLENHAHSNDELRVQWHTETVHRWVCNEKQFMLVSPSSRLSLSLSSFFVVLGWREIDLFQCATGKHSNGSAHKYHFRFIFRTANNRILRMCTIFRLSIGVCVTTTTQWRSSGWCAHNGFN